MVLVKFKNVSRVNYSTLLLPQTNIFSWLSVFDMEISITLPTHQIKMPGVVLKPIKQTKIRSKQLNKFSGVFSTHPISPLLPFDLSRIKNDYTE